MFDNASLCSKCGGVCCKGTPGCCYPSDFKLTGWVTGAHEYIDARKLKEALLSGRYCIDWYEGDVRGMPYDNWEHPEHKGRCLYVRPATLGREGMLLDGGWSHMCTFWSLAQGCELGSDERPYECRMLEPKDRDKGESCIAHAFGRSKAALAWLPYEEVLNRVMEEIREQTGDLT